MIAINHSVRTPVLLGLLLKGGGEGVDPAAVQADVGGAGLLRRRQLPPDLRGCGAGRRRAGDNRGNGGNGETPLD